MPSKNTPIHLTLENEEQSEPSTPPPPVKRGRGRPKGRGDAYKRLEKGLKKSLTKKERQEEIRKRKAAAEAADPAKRARLNGEEEESESDRSSGQMLLQRPGLIAPNPSQEKDAEGKDENAGGEEEDTEGEVKDAEGEDIDAEGETDDEYDNTANANTNQVQDPNPRDNEREQISPLLWEPVSHNVSTPVVPLMSFQEQHYEPAPPNVWVGDVTPQLPTPFFDPVTGNIISIPPFHSFEDQFMLWLYNRR